MNDENDAEIASRRNDSLGRRQLGGGRLGTYTMIGAATGLIPLPWVPDAVARRVRGALVHDLTSRQGISLTPEARAALVEPEGAEGPRAFISQGLKFGVARLLGRFGPMAMISPVRSALGTFVLGHLLHRYLESRTARNIRMEIEEARRVRRAIDQAFVYALTTEGKRSREDLPIPPEDLRDQTTQLVDGVLVSIASMPGWLVRRLDAAFDDIMASLKT